MKARAKIAGSIVFLIVVMFGSFMGPETPTATVQASEGNHLSAECYNCSDEKYRYNCLDDNQTLVTVYVTCTCPDTGETDVILDQYFVNGCIAS